MEERSSHLTVVVGASGIAEDLRRSLVQHDVAHAGVATHLRGLRRSMVAGGVLGGGVGGFLGADDFVVVCIALDTPTLRRHGQALRQLLADHHCFPQNVRSVGLLTQIGLTSAAAEMGCDVYVDDSEHAAHAINLLTRHWQDQRLAPDDRSNGALDAATAVSDRNAWTWGLCDLPVEFTSLVAARLVSTPPQPQKPSNAG